MATLHRHNICVQLPHPNIQRTPTPTQAPVQEGGRSLNQSGHPIYVIHPPDRGTMNPASGCRRPVKARPGPGWWVRWGGRVSDAETGGGK
ncbi:MAG: hypothetical protein M8353_09290 [ANME-2 cluster archaeon]|nr:hypothetical protein [ANME-2 cluster archaeon]